MYAIYIEFQQKTENFLVLAFIGLSPGLHSQQRPPKATKLKQIKVLKHMWEWSILTLEA